MEIDELEESVAAVEAALETVDGLSGGDPGRDVAAEILDAVPADRFPAQTDGVEPAS